MSSDDAVRGLDDPWVQELPIAVQLIAVRDQVRVTGRYDAPAKVTVWVDGVCLFHRRFQILARDEEISWQAIVQL
ncbi:hypothetical protein [Streptomyces hokutonensis]|uniref:hypothetical protein n=1 Tax=Streptomyces hokutonensis TaxID=1306990 RepID=UPI003821F28E